MEDIALRMREILERRGLSVNAYAKKLGIPQSTLQSQLQGKYGLSLKTIIRMLVDFEVSADWLLLGVGSMERQPHTSSHSVSFSANESQHVAQSYSANGADVVRLNAQIEFLQAENNELKKDKAQLWELLSKRL